MPGTPQYADITGDFNVVGGHGGSEQWFDPSVFSQPGTGELGNTKRNQFYGPGYKNMDFSFFRAVPVGGNGKRAEFRVEIFNLTNSPKWGQPDGNLASSNFGKVTTVGDGSRDAGSGERQIRIGLRFQF